MITLSVILLKIKKSQLTASQTEYISKAVRDEFAKVFSIQAENVEVNLAEGRGHKGDMVIAYDKLPPVLNAVQLLKTFNKRVAENLKNVFSDEIIFNGEVYSCNISEVTKSSASQDSTSGGENSGGSSGKNETSAAEIDKLAEQFYAETPKFTFDQLVLAEDVANNLNEAIAILEFKDKLFDEWGLSKIMNPSVLINLYGESGTGKTMAAEAIANKMGLKIIRASYADIESKYHGEGPKKLKAIFKAAADQNAVLFIDEADSMLSARLGNISDSSAQAINSMRSQLLICLEQYNGIVIFATNLIKNYDSAFLTRLVCVEMKRPDRDARLKIWENHLEGKNEKKLSIPLGELDYDELSSYDFSGRDIRNAVKYACIHAVVAQKDIVEQSDLIYACEKALKEINDLKNAKNQNTSDTKMKVPDSVREVIQQKAKKVQ